MKNHFKSICSYNVMLFMLVAESSRELDGPRHPLKWPTVSDSEILRLASKGEGIA